MQSHDNIIDDIKNVNPDIVINDILDTSIEYMNKLRKLDVKIINFEDLGEGAELADVVINALYPEKEILPNYYFGYKYFCPKDEFYFSDKKVVSEQVNNILITFGGVDENNLSLKILESIYDFCKANHINIDIVVGLGYTKINSLKKYEYANIYQNVKNISDFMLKADIIFTSAGRTVYEIACLGVPAIILAQNEIEMTHFFVSQENGFINLGLGAKINKKKILDMFAHLVKNDKERQYMNKLMLSKDVKAGKENVIKIIRDVIGD